MFKNHINQENYCYYWRECEKYFDCDNMNCLDDEDYSDAAIHKFLNKLGNEDLSNMFKEKGPCSKFTLREGSDHYKETD
ncbi:uncharacterized protein PMUG01_05042300 [Plasmodium malariae]|uniref:Uncharacterized protein n=1 Tax=Plasmodium malariae TaxID=5858 RepID=A0A1D3JLT5_PLAMA|nr:uncharacterized protein PMUG01_05042300 [Plasmodium malariae]SBT87560.1 hypothetical protein PMUG01_05042300 [Plasmodium malariae]